MGALPIFAPDGVERALAATASTVPAMAAARFGRPATFTIAPTATSPFHYQDGSNDISADIAYTIFPVTPANGENTGTVDCSLVTTNQSISLVCGGSSNIGAFVANNLISIDPSNLNGGSLSIDGGSTSGQFVAVKCPVLNIVGGTISITAETTFFVIQCLFPVLVSTGGITISGALTLSSLSFPQYSPGNTESDDFSGNSLSVTSVNGILEQWALNTSFVGTLDLSGGTSAAPTGAGATAKAALITQGATVTTN